MSCSTSEVQLLGHNRGRRPGHLGRERLGPASGLLQARAAEHLPARGVALQPSWKATRRPPLPTGRTRLPAHGIGRLWVGSPSRSTSRKESRHMFMNVQRFPTIIQCSWSTGVHHIEFRPRRVGYRRRKDGEADRMGPVSRGIRTTSSTRPGSASQPTKFRGFRRGCAATRGLVAEFACRMPTQAYDSTHRRHRTRYGWGPCQLADAKETCGAERGAAIARRSALSELRLLVSADNFCAIASAAEASQEYAGRARGSRHSEVHHCASSLAVLPNAAIPKPLPQMQMAGFVWASAGRRSLVGGCHQHAGTVAALVGRAGSRAARPHAEYLQRGGR